MVKFTKNSTDVLIITPIFYGSASGAAIYYKLLSRKLIQQGFSVTIISEKATTSNDIPYHGIFPKRCSRNKRMIKDFAFYAIQNIAYLLIPKIVKIYRPKNLLVHSSFYNFPGIFPAVMEYLRQTQPKMRIVVDIRDRLVPPLWIKKIEKFNKVIACSENVKTYLFENGINRKSVKLIPVIQEPIQINETFTRNTISCFNLNNKKYIFYAGLIKEKKAIDTILNAFLLYIRKKIPDIHLVISGLIKTSNKKILQLLSEESVLYLGNRRREEVLSLMSRASLCINISPNEGMPRTCLESLALKRPTVLPPNIPEFNSYCSDFVYTGNCPRDLANKIVRMIQCKTVATYPIEKHFPSKVFPKYKEILQLH